LGITCSRYEIEQAYTAANVYLSPSIGSAPEKQELSAMLFYGIMN
jgi:hypothetical protein